jgi:hypothetical protein
MGDGAELREVGASEGRNPDCIFLLEKASAPQDR